MPPIDRVLFASTAVQIGAFRCPIDHPRFQDSGPISDSLVAFPRGSVWIRQAGSRRVAADASIATIYNRGRRYDRAAISAEGDRSDWFALMPEVAVAMAREIDPRAPDEPERAFRFEVAPTRPELYLRQRRLFLAVERRELEPLEIEEAVIGLVEIVLRQAAGQAGRREMPTSTARRDLVEHAKAALSRDIAGPTELGELSRQLGVSASHLCRVFLQATGFTLHQYRVNLRLRAALERLESGGADLSRLAADLGFSSHSHFTAVFRRRWGAIPTRFRALLSGPLERSGSRTRQVSASVR